MTIEEFQTLTQQTVLLDGATGSVLMSQGMPKGICTELWEMEHKDLVVNLQKAYVEAGSQIIIAPTFGANSCNLKKHGLADRLEELNHTLVSYSKEAAQGKAYVAGDITTTGEMLEPFGDMTYEEAFDIYKEQITCLANAGVDLIVAETLFNIQEACAAVDAAKAVCDLPVMCTMTSEADGSFFTGGNILEAAPMLEAAGASAVGLNCSVGPEQLAAIIKSLVQKVSIPVIAKPNAGMPVISPSGEAIYQMAPEDFAQHMKVLKGHGARLLGGCCGTTPAFIAQLSLI